MKILVLGHKDHGKDEASKLLCQEYDMTYLSSSEVGGELVVYPAIKEKYGYECWLDCFNDRDNHRIEWRDLIREYNVPDKTRLVRRILQKADIYCGMRCDLEYQASKYLFDAVFWVDAAVRKPQVDESLTIRYSHTEMIRIGNNGPKRRLINKVREAYLKSL